MLERHPIPSSETRLHLTPSGDGKMKMRIMFTPEDEGDEKALTNFITKQRHPNTQLTANVCSKCGKPVDQKVVNYCKIQYQGKTLCRECQEGD